MTKASDFILNSDFLALAQKSTNEFTMVFPHETFSGPTTVYERNFEFNVPSVQGAIDEIAISYNGSEYALGNSIHYEGTNMWTDPAGLGVSVHRISPNTLQVKLYISVYDAYSYDMPDQTIKVRISSYLPPNIF